ncbi:uncharacterized protein LOC111444697 isoform X1 [Cucurbita moschata]|uniref:Uncharacterized protein LOC111444697 isoform X1 n=1 Tax=Cucurbita moschata TaxID=3662 RepID=A0A6J1FJW0_CUCMO|nr:uncharacterized protein LOC111444697 isoform X1 [Cucurbita moschata]
MEDEHQKMVALKKAYADIILNTVKEAAARVMVSERKALFLQQDLFSVKDEAHRMLLRLKNMIDSKTRETEIASLCHRKKVEELEAQFHEAEDVITDLRIQLKEVQSQLEKEKKDNTFSSQSTLEPDSSSPSSSELQAVSSNLKNTKMEQIAQAMSKSVPKSIEQSSVSQVDIVHSHDSDSTSTVVRTKEHRSSRKRCPQRIHALERNFLDNSLSLGIDVKDSQVLEENEPLGKRRDKEERGLSTRTGKTDIWKNVHGAVLKRSVKIHTSRRTSGPHLKVGDVSSDKSEYQPSLMADSGNVTQNSCLPEEHKIDSYKDASGNSNGGQPKGNMKRGIFNGHLPDQPINPCDMSVLLSPCRTSINQVNDSGKSGEDYSNTTKHQRKMKKLNCLDTGLTSTDKKMMIRCTRQSKRKREAMGISDENISPGKSNGKRWLGEKLKFESEFERSDLIKESTRESRQLSQVARQLVSLSRERWQ